MLNGLHQLRGKREEPPPLLRSSAEGRGSPSERLAPDENQSAFGSFLRPISEYFTNRRFNLVHVDWPWVGSGLED